MIRLGVVFGIFTVFALVSAADLFSERVHYECLSSSAIRQRFEFEIDSPVINEHADLFPVAISTVLRKSNTTFVRATFGQGQWLWQQWGAQLSPIPNGAEVWISFDKNSNSDVDAEWTKLVTSLSGAFGASLGLMDLSRSAVVNDVNLVPHTAYTCDSAEKQRHSAVSSEHRRGQLPRESLCTETTAPWLRLTPCKGKAGVSALLKTTRACEAAFTGIGMEYSKCGEGGKLYLWAETVSKVHHCHTSSENLLYALSIDSLPRSCAAANKSDIYLGDEVLPFSEAQSLTLQSVPLFSEQQQQQRGEDGSSIPSPDTPLSVLEFNRVLRGGAVRASVVSTASVPLRFSYFDSLPWFVRLYTATAQSSCEGTECDLVVVPAADRQAPGTIYWNGVIQPGQKLALTVMYELGFLHIGEYPPDPNRGFDVGSAILHFSPLTTSSSASDTAADTTTTAASDNLSGSLVSSGAVVHLSSPDFSMPFNVAAITTTIYALLFGSILNILLDRSKLKAGRPVRERLLTRLMGRLANKFGGKKQSVNYSPVVVATTTVSSPAATTTTTTTTTTTVITAPSSTTNGAGVQQ